MTIDVKAIACELRTRLGLPLSRGQASIDRLAKKWPNAHLVHVPVHASWLNQVEIYFSVIQRKVLTPTTSPT